MLSTYSLQGLHHGSLPEIFADKHALAARPREMRKAKRWAEATWARHAAGQQITGHQSDSRMASPPSWATQ
jgi:hypothetical protein